MTHKIMSWNVKGLGGADKHPAIRDCIRRVKARIVFIQETKFEMISPSLARAIWGIPNAKWEFLPFIGASGDVCNMGH